MGQQTMTSRSPSAQTAIKLAELGTSSTTTETTVKGMLAKLQSLKVCPRTLHLKIGLKMHHIVKVERTLLITTTLDYGHRR